MSLNSTPSGERVHIGFFGRRNAGKSSIVNAVTNQEISVVSDVRGTTTDPVIKSMELLPLGPVVIIDTPGFDDEGALGEKRVQRAKRVLNRADLAVLVIDAQTGAAEADRELIALFKENQPIPFAVHKTGRLSCSFYRAEICAVKHLKACEYIVSHQLEGALVLEDDIVLRPRFREDFEKTIERLKADAVSEIHYADSCKEIPVPKWMMMPGMLPGVGIIYGRK